MTTPEIRRAIVAALVQADVNKPANARHEYYTNVVNNKMEKLGIADRSTRYIVFKWLFDDGHVFGKAPDFSEDRRIHFVQIDGVKPSVHDFVKRSNNVSIHATNSSPSNDARSVTRTADSLDPIFQQLVETLEHTHRDLDPTVADDADNDIQQLKRELSKPQVNHRQDRIDLLIDNLNSVTPLAPLLQKLTELVR